MSTMIRAFKASATARRMGVSPEQFARSMPWIDREAVLAAPENGRRRFRLWRRSVALVREGDDFALALRAATIFDRLGGRRVPLLTRLFDGIAAARSCIGSEESKAIPLSRPRPHRQSRLPGARSGRSPWSRTKRSQTRPRMAKRVLTADLAAAAAAALDNALLDQDNAGSARRPRRSALACTPLTQCRHVACEHRRRLERMLDARRRAG